MNASRLHHEVSDRVVRGFDGGPRRGCTDLPPRLARLGEVPGFREGHRRTNVLVLAIDPVVPAGLPHAERVSLSDEWLDLSLGLTWSRAGGLGWHPVETVSQSEGGFEGV